VLSPARARSLSIAHSLFRYLFRSPPLTEAENRSSTDHDKVAYDKQAPENIGLFYIIQVSFVGFICTRDI